MVAARGPSIDIPVRVLRWPGQNAAHTKRRGAWLTIAVALAQNPGIGPDGFQDKLDLVIELNTTAGGAIAAYPGPAAPHLDIASPTQYAEYAYLEARNLTLSGVLAGALEKICALLDRDISPQQRIRVYRLGVTSTLPS